MKVIDRITGEILECSLWYKLREEAHQRMSDYKEQGIETYMPYIGDGVYEIKEYPIKGGEIDGKNGSK